MTCVGVISESTDAVDSERNFAVQETLESIGFDCHVLPPLSTSQAKDAMDECIAYVCILTQAVFDSGDALKLIRRALRKRKPVIFLLAWELPFLSMESAEDIKEVVFSAYKNIHSKVSFDGARLTESARKIMSRTLRKLFPLIYKDSATEKPRRNSTDALISSD